MGTRKLRDKIFGLRGFHNLSAAKDKKWWLLILLIAASACILLWKVPPIQVDHLKVETENVNEFSVTPKTIVELENEARKTLAQVIAGVFIGGGAVFAWRRVRASERTANVAEENLRLAQDGQRVAQETLKVTQEGEITQRFSKAIELLGSKEIKVSLGGIYALERIARESDKDHWPIIEILAASVRVTTVTEEYKKEYAAQPREDVQAAMTVIGRRNIRFDPKDSRIDLRYTHLVRVRLDRANLSRVRFRGANLSRTRLGYPIFRGATFSGADLRQTDLRETTDLTQEQIDSAITDETTILPEGLTRPSQRQSENP